MTGTATPPLDLARKAEREAPWSQSVERYRHKLARARAYLLLRHPLFGKLALDLQLVISDEIATAAVSADGVVYWNPDFLEKMTVGETAAVMAHEILHLGLDIWGRCGAKDPQRWCRAQDHVINNALKRSGLPLPGGERFGFMPLCDPAYDRYSDEEVYLRLGNADNRAPQSQDGGEKRGGFGTDWGDVDFASIHRLKESRKDPSLRGKHSPREWQAAFERLAGAAMMRGTLPGTIERMVIGPKDRRNLPWQVLLRRALTTQVGSRSSMLRPSRKSAALQKQLTIPSGARALLPGRASAAGTVVIACDTSGSISQEELGFFIEEARRILKHHPGPVRALACDAEVHCDVNLRREDLRLTGGGGSRTEPVFEALDIGRKPAMLIYFTDLYVSFPTTPPGYPVVWIKVGTGKHGRVPFGMVIEASRQSPVARVESYYGGIRPII